MIDEATYEGVELRQRIVGALVLLGLACLILPIAFKHPVSSAVKAQSPYASQQNTLPSKPMIVIPPKPSTSDVAKKSERRATLAPPIKIAKPVKKLPMPTPIIKKLPIKKAVVTTHKKMPTVIKTPHKAKAKVTPTKKTTWLIQIGSFSAHAHAVSLTSKLKKAGFKTRLQEKHVHKHIIWQVFVGPSHNKGAAEKMKAQVERKLKTKTILKRAHA